jgi:Rieske Fe-S protein
LIETELETGKYISRKSFLRLVTLTSVAAFIALWNAMIGKQNLLSDKPVANNINAAKLGTGIYFFERVILAKKDAILKVFSNKCTHAGCKINQEIDGKLICPCHGSKYEAFSGKVIQGPAGLPLKSIPYSVDAKSGDIIFNI